MSDAELDRLREPAPQGARHLALDLLEAAAAARTRLDDPADQEALHDFRVALRRLRSALATFGAELGESGGKANRRRWRDLAGATGAGRDAEAQGEWLRAGLPRMVGNARPAARALLERLDERRRREAAEVARSARRFERLAAKLKDQLACYTVRLDEGAPEASFGEVAALQTHELARELAARLAQIEGPRDVAGAHAARIAGKRLRYALEVAAPASRHAVGRLRELQDLLGELHDVHGLIGRAAKRARRQAEDRARDLAQRLLEHGASSEEFRQAARRGSRPSWWPLLDALRARTESLHGRLAEAWLEGGEPAVAQRLDDLVGAAQAEAEVQGPSGRPAAPRRQPSSAAPRA